MAKKDKVNKERLEKLEEIIEEAKEEDVELEMVTKKDEAENPILFEAPRKRK